MNITQSNLLWGALLGSTLGAAAILLLTPTSGKKVRDRLQSYLHSKPKQKSSRHNIVHKYMRKAKRTASQKKHK